LGHADWRLCLGCLQLQEHATAQDPDTPVKTAVAITPWPGVNAEKVEQLVTRKIEEKIAQNANVEKIRSISRTNVSVVYVDLMRTFQAPRSEGVR
jgi:multidrug efflux pump subunit AcrB